jgi:hypothetical protein
VSFLVKVVVNGAVDSGKFLQTSHPAKAKHRPLPSSEWLMRVLGAVVDPSADLALVDAPELLQSRAIGWQSIRHDRFGPAMHAQRFPEEIRFADLRFNAAFLSRRFVTKLSSTSPL